MAKVFWIILTCDFQDEPVVELPVITPNPRFAEDILSEQWNRHAAWRPNRGWKGVVREGTRMGKILTTIYDAADAEDAA